jgi:hypothetical protein
MVNISVVHGFFEHDSSVCSQSPVKCRYQALSLIDLGNGGFECNRNLLPT